MANNIVKTLSLFLDIFSLLKLSFQSDLPTGKATESIILSTRDSLFWLASLVARS